MKNNLYAIFIVNLLVTGILAQEETVISIENILTIKENNALEKALQYKSDFFNRLFSEKTVNSWEIKFVVANNYRDYLYIQSEYGHIKLNSFGFFSAKDSTVVVFKNKKNENPNIFMRTCYHELSHAFLHLHIGNNYVPAWFIEGLAIYHAQMTFDRKNTKQHINNYYVKRVKTLIQLKEINLTEFVNLDYKKFSIESFSQEGYGYAIGYCMILFLMQQSEDKAFKIFRSLVNEYSATEVFDKYYSGGFSQFEKDFIERFR